MEEHYNKLQGNPTFINGFEDVINYIKNRELRIKNQEAEIKRLRRELNDFVSVFDGNVRMKEMTEENKKLKENLERVTKVRDDFAHTCAALNTALDIVEYNGVVCITKEELDENIESRGEPDNDKLVKILYEFYEVDEDNQ